MCAGHSAATHELKENPTERLPVSGKGLTLPSCVLGTCSALSTQFKLSAKIITRANAGKCLKVTAKLLDNITATHQVRIQASLWYFYTIHKSLSFFPTHDTFNSTHLKLTSSVVCNVNYSYRQVKDAGILTRSTSCFKFYLRCYKVGGNGDF